MLKNFDHYFLRVFELTPHLVNWMLVEEVEEYLLSVSAVVGDEVSAGELVVSWACSVDLLVEG